MIHTLELHHTRETSSKPERSKRSRRAGRRLPRHGSSTTKIKARLSRPREIPPRREVSTSLFLVSRGRALLVKLINNASVGSSAS